MTITDNKNSENVSNTNKNKQEIRVRFAPSPTGMLHIGGARTAIDNWAFARTNGGKFILRIEDTDPERSTKENVDIIIRALKWLGLDWDEGPGKDCKYGPYFQMQRLDSYEKAIDYMWKKDRCYPCFCTKEEIYKKRKIAEKEEGGYSGYDRTCRSIPKDVAIKRMKSGESFVWRLKVPDNHPPIEFDDAVYGHMSFPSEVMDDLVLTRSSDGVPTYNFAVVCDDSNMKISHVIRGDDHLSNTPRQILIYEALDKPIPQFAHLSMILGPDKHKLSKRHGSTSVEEYAARGYLPDALINYLALLGWSLDGETTIIPPDVLCKNFSLDRVNRKDCIFDEKKLDWMNGYYIRDLGEKNLAEISKIWFAKAIILGHSQARNGNCVIPTPDKLTAQQESRKIKSYDPKDIEAALIYVEKHFDNFKKMCPLIIERLNRLDEIPNKLSFFFWGENLVLDEKSKNKVLCKPGLRAKEALQASLSVISDNNLDWQCEILQNKCQELTEKFNIKPRLLFQPLRVAVCGNMVSPPLFESIELMKRNNVISRIKTALDFACD